jgi:hypothetical protein
MYECSKFQIYECCVFIAYTQPLSLSVKNETEQKNRD